VTGQAARGPFRLFAFVVAGLSVDLPTVMGWQESPIVSAESQPQVQDVDLEFFESRIRPLLVKHCQECHSGDEPSGGLNLQISGGAAMGGDSGPAVVAGKPDDSRLIQAVRYDGVIQMPPDSQLAAETVALLEEWVRRGAPWPADRDRTGDGSAPFPAVELLGSLEWQRRASHWAWQSPADVTPPEATLVDWRYEPIDRFVYAKMTAAGLQPSPGADRATLLRRAFWNLTGILPTAGELSAFVADPAPDAEAFARQVDRLLASPRFGERFARHWLDLVRYAETCGHEFDYAIPHAWQYRDWVIRAFNEDVPYDQFVREQIAGDLLEQPRLHPVEKYNESILGTGFWFLGEATHGPVDVRANEAGHIDNRIDVMSKTFMAMTVACARCHDHKFDAITDEDFYALAGMLQSSRRQLTFIDFNGQTEQAAANTRAVMDRADDALDQAVDRLRNLDREELVRRIVDVVQLSRTRPAPPSEPAARFQGEDFVLPESPPGTVEVQTIAAHGDFAWEGDRQLWWHDAADGDSLRLEFESPVSGEVEVWANLTLARDYGVVQFALDGQSLGSPVDCYSASLAISGRRSLGKLEVEPGKHTFSVTLTGVNEKAIPRRMFGLDWLELVSLDSLEGDNTWQDALAQAAQRHNLGADTLEGVVESAGAIMFDWPPTGLGEKSVGETVQRSMTFSDFSQDANGWTATGWAFDLPTSTRHLTVDGHLLPSGVAAGSRTGRQLQGALRSPTFEITHPRIHWLLRGGNVRLRVIVDGFDLDTDNPLLFEGLSPVIADQPDWRWVTIAGDLKNHIGHRAWLEVLDHGEGAVDIARIEFSAGDPPPDALVTLSAESQAPTVAGDNDPADSMRNLLEFVLASQPDQDPFAHQVARNQVLAWLTTGEGRWLVRSEPSPDQTPATEIDGGPRASLAVAPESALLELLAEANSAAGSANPPALAIAMAEGTPENEFLFIRGNHRNLGPAIPRRSLEVLAGRTAVDWSQIRGCGRLELAEELTDPRHPLVARVMVNRLWHHLFGEGLVRSPDNFGMMGSAPTHPELLDWLAREFVADGWSVKRMIRRMMLSRTWQQAVQAPSESIAADPDNRLWGRALPRRMDGESLRDSMLAISGRLDGTMFGPPVPIHLTEFMQGRGRPGQSGPLDGNGRRSIYIEVRRNFLNPFMLAFDTPIPFNSMGRRNVSNVPAQALILMNDPLVIEQAGLWAKQLTESVADPARRIDEAFLAATGRLPDESQRSECLALIEQLTSGGADELSAWSALCHVIWNSKAFTFVF
jgi:Protein of unknown function (DUF1553)/Protein of unknown function (DUF1549)/Planctomycete cytochrome C